MPSKTLALALALAATTPLVARADVVTMWAAHTSGRMVDIYDVERSDTNLLAASHEFQALAAAAYQGDWGELPAQVAENGFELVDVDEARGTNTQYVLVRDGHRAVVAFRGTERGGAGAAGDWLINAQTLLEPAGVFAGAHSGFAAKIRSVMLGLESSIDDLLADGVTEVWLTGHSLGGALAQLMAHRLQFNEKPVGGVFSFGAPAVGQGGWATEYTLESRTHLFEADDDLVLCMPADGNWARNGIGHRVHAFGIHTYSGRTDCTSLAADVFDTISGILTGTITCNKAAETMNKGRGWRIFRSLLLSIVRPQINPACLLPDPVEQGIQTLSSFVIDGRSFSAHANGRYRDRIALALPPHVLATFDAR